MNIWEGAIVALVICGAVFLAAHMAEAQTPTMMYKSFNPEAKPPSYLVGADDVAALVSLYSS